VSLVSKTIPAGLFSRTETHCASPNEPKPSDSQPGPEMAVRIQIWCKKVDERSQILHNIRSCNTILVSYIVFHRDRPEDLFPPARVIKRGTVNDDSASFCLRLLSSTSARFIDAVV
jgi:hypothetical protein